MLLKSACWRHLLGSLLVLGLVLGVVGDARADLSWFCTDFNIYQDIFAGSAPHGAYCSTATITGSISASITAADRNAIINGVTGSAVMTNIKNNTEYTKDGNTWSAARWAAEGYSLTNSIINDDTYGLKKINSQISSIHTAVSSNIPLPFIHSLKGKNNTTATKNGTFTVVVEAQNATQYRGKCDNSGWTAWTTNKEVIITGISKGVRTITIEAKNSKDETYSKEMMAFSLQGGINYE